MTDSRTTFAARWRQAVAAVPDDAFLTWEGSDGRVATWTYSAFDGLVREVENGLRARGVGRGDRVLLTLRNSPAFVATWLATAAMGACIVPCDPQSSERELALVIQRTLPRLGVSGGRSRAALDSAAAQPSLATVHVDEDDVQVEPLRGAAAPRGAGTTDAPQPRDAAAIMFTSGTTSAPKGVVVTQANYAFAGDVMAGAAALRRGDRCMVVLPLFHANAQYYSFAAAISAGASVVLMHAFSAGGFLEQAARHQATHASLFAAPMRMILARGTPVDGLRLRHCWYAQNVTAEQYEELALLMGCRPRQLYGMTETIPAVLSNRALDARPDSMGQATLGCAVSLHGVETGEAVPDGEVGEVVVGGIPGVTLFDGYLDDPGTTAAAFRGSWFRTGDRATRDAGGRYFFAGRGGDILKVAGENVSAVEVESVLAAHPAVFEAAVTGEPDPVRDEVPVAYVVLRGDGATATADDLLTWCEHRLAPAKRPRRVHLVAELPRTSVGKIRKFMLPQLAGAAAGERR